jgi:8-oxo-dGTP diphosphatase
MRTILVAAAIVIQGGKVLLTQRKKDSHLEGLWEFPGGKIEAGEDPRAALVRELREELGVETEVGDIVEVTFHRYEDAEKAVLLLFYETRLLPSSPPPRALDVAAFEWSGRDGLAPSRFPPADVDVLTKVARKLQ